MGQGLNILQVDNLSKYFGGLAAVLNCSLKIQKGSITGVIGPNGSGKTTLFNLIAGNLKPSSGNVLFCGENITGIPSYELFSKGLLRTFQIAHEFTNLTVLENLMMVPGNQSGEHLTNALFNPKKVNQEEKKIKQKALEVIDFLNLTQLSNELAGNLEASRGTVLFDNEDITNIPSYELFSKGVLRTFQIAHEFTNLTVLENLMMVPGKQSGENLVNALFKPGIVKKEEEKVKEKALEVIDFLNLKHLSNELAGNLSGGQKKLLELGRTMMVDAKLVLLDEVGAGVNRTLLKDIGSAILRLNKEKGYTFCMIEHDMEFISRLCNPVIVMAEGSVLFEGTSDEVKKNEQVIDSYLGRGSKLKDKS